MFRFSSFFHHYLAVFCKDFKFFRSKMNPKMSSSDVRKPLENLNFEVILVFEDCDGSRMPKMHSGEFRIFLKNF